MGIGTLLGYLIGSRDAILTLAEHPRTLLIGVIFVLSAGFAREYDGEDLLHEPWYLAIPLGASLASSFALFAMLYLPTWIAGTNVPPFAACYRAFLGVFWMTAPLAWLYAIPYERLLDPVSAVYANVWTLIVVSFWRVALMVRVGVVLFGLSPRASLYRVLAYADTVALIAMSFLPFPIIEIMGGVRVSEAENAVRSMAQIVAFWGGCSLLIWWLLALSAGNRNAWALPRRKDDALGASNSENGGGAPVSWPLRILAILSLAGWIPLLLLTQPEQQLRWRVDSAFREGRYRDALIELSAHKLEDFPPQWEPPPRFLKGERSTQIFEVWDEILRMDVAPWVRQLYLERFKNYVERGRHWDVEKVAKLVNQLPEGKAILRQLDTDVNREWELGLLDALLTPELRKSQRAE